jgi:hypothetical protein
MYPYPMMAAMMPTARTINIINQRFSISISFSGSKFPYNGLLAQKDIKPALITKRFVVIGIYPPHEGFAKR